MLGECLVANGSEGKSAARLQRDLDEAKVLLQSQIEVRV